MKNENTGVACDGRKWRGKDSTHIEGGLGVEDTCKRRPANDADKTGKGQFKLKVKRSPTKTLSTNTNASPWEVVKHAPIVKNRQGESPSSPTHRTIITTSSLANTLGDPRIEVNFFKKKAKSSRIAVKGGAVTLGSLHKAPHVKGYSTLPNNSDFALQNFVKL